MNTKTTITSVIVSIVVVIVGLLVSSPSSKTIIQTSPVNNVVKGTSPEISSPYLIVNGITEWYNTQQMRTATTTLCSFPAPSASSTIVYVSLRVTGNSGTTGKIDVGTSTAITGTSTNTLISGFSAATGTGTGWLPPSFGVATISNGQFLNVVTDTLSASTTGSCQAEYTAF